jgi:restriction system protein
MTIPSYEELMPMVLIHSTSERLVRDAVAYISKELKLTEDELAETIPSGTEKLISSRVQWALTYLVQAGLIKRPRRAHFIITESGRDVLANEVDKLNLKYLRSFPDFQDFLSRKGTRKSSGKTQLPDQVIEGLLDKNPEELIGLAYEEIESELSEQILERVLQNTPAFFEHLVVKLLSSMGYGRPDTFAEVMGKVGDGGIDGIIHQDKLGLDVVYIQAKRYAVGNTVSRPEWTCRGIVPLL